MLKQSPIIDCFATAEFQFAAVNGMRIATLSNNHDNHHRPVGDYVADLSASPKRLVVGVEARTWLAQHGIDAPSGLLEYRIIEGRSTVVRFHHQQYLLISGISVMAGSAFASVFDLDEGRHGNVLVLDYECAEFAVGGPHLAVLLAELCAMDFAAAPEGIWIATRMAHCEVSLQLGRAGDAAVGADSVRERYVCRVICSPAEGQFLFGIIKDVIDQHAGSVLGFNDYVTNVANGGVLES